MFSFQGVELPLYTEVFVFQGRVTLYIQYQARSSHVSGGWNRGFHCIYNTKVSSFQEVGIEGVSLHTYRGVVLSKGWE